MLSSTILMVVLLGWLSVGTLQCHSACASGCWSDGLDSCLGCRNNYLSRTCYYLGLLKSDCCSCPSGTYFNDGSFCPACSYQCNTCSGSATSCNTCSSSTRSSPPACSCNGGYYDSGSATCSLCHYSCLNCSGSSTACTSCSSSRYRSISGSSCPCILRYFDSGSATCSACHYSCRTCTAASSTSCSSCYPSFNRFLSGSSCICIDGYYQAGSSTCATCHYSCSTCSSASSCTGCDSLAKRVFASSSTYCICQDRFYDPGSQQCISCHPTCFRCFSSTSTTCTACNPLAFRVKSGSSCVCMDGYFQTSSSLQLCTACSYSCLTCTSSATTCISCNATQNRVLSSNSCPCKAKYFENANKLCDDCHPSCATCTNSTACLTCISSQATTLNSSTLCSCTSSQFFNGTSCQACSYRCLTCVDSSIKCLSCPLNSNRVYSNNACDCVSRFFDNNVATCAACHYTCLTCSGATITACLTCDSATLRSKSGSSCPCPTGYYDGGLAACLQCHYSCLTCTNGSACSSCDAAKSRSLSGTTGLCVCPSNYFESSQLCYACLSTCLTCTNNASCTTCDPALNRALNIRTLQCDCETIGYFLDSAGGTCKPCLSICHTCSDATTCTLCKPGLYRTLNRATSTCDCQTGYILNTTSNTCMGCQYSCQVCVVGHNNLCASCVAAHSRTLDSSTQQCPCNTGFYDDGINSLCLACSYTCKTCSQSASNCTQCPASSFRALNSSGGCPCIQHYYDTMAIFVQSPICSACLYHCSSCVDPSSCLTCNATNYRRFDSNNISCICSVGYFDDKTNNQQCKACSYQCQSCTNLTHCLTCNSTNHRALPNQLCPCVQGFYDTQASEAMCNPCHYSCKTCTNGSACVSCELSYSRLFNTTSKLCYCLGRYFDPGEHACQSCSYSCLTCETNALKCLTCNTTSLRTLDPSSNTCPCNDGYYDSAIEPCFPCQYSCRTCGNNLSCLTCNASNFRQLNRFSGLCDCMISYYDTLNQTQLCARCQLTCLTCLNETECTSCDRARNRTLNLTKDYANQTDPFCSCIYSHYSPATNSSCLPCHFSCAVCDGPALTNCLFCDSYSKRELNGTKCTCIKGFYDTNLTSQCPLCHVACSSCWDNKNTTCFECSPTFFMAVGNNTCFLTCPTYYFDNTTAMVCSPCSTHCLVCLNGSYCTSCEAPTFLNVSSCIQQCPYGQYGNQTTHTCEPCRDGCANCTASYNCFKCVNDSYYVDSATTLCFQCSSLCVTCFGPNPSQCLNCTYPLYLNSRHTCVDLICPFGQYVDTFQGCVSCSKLFPNSLSCNISQAFLCKTNTLLSNGVCVACDQVPGYATDSSGDCNQICGDGILLKYQCDDGNKRSGDGCSANCVIEKGWSCKNETGKSVCTLTSAISMSVKYMHKYRGRNRLLVGLSISLPLYLDSTNFGMKIISVDSSLYSVAVLPQTNLNEIFCMLNYQTDINNKEIELQYNHTSRRRLMELPSPLEISATSPNRQLATVTFQMSVTVKSFPPANYVSDDTLAFHQRIQGLIEILALTFTILNLVIIPRKNGLHSVSTSWIVPYIFIVYFHSTAYTTQWISFSAAELKHQSLLGGISLGRCCKEDTFQGTTSELFSNIGLILLISAVSWGLFGVMKLIQKCSGSESAQKAAIIIRYYLFTIHLVFMLQIAYFSLYSLSNYQLNNQLDSANITLSLFLFFAGLFGSGAIWHLTAANKFEGTEDTVSSKAATRQTVQDKEPTNKTEEDRYHQVINLSQIKQTSKYDNSDFYKTNSMNSLNSGEPITASPSQPRKQSLYDENEDTLSVEEEQMGGHQSFFPAEYCFAYKNRHPKSKYFLPLLLIKLLMISITNCALKQTPLGLVIVNSILSLCFLSFLVRVRPFQSGFTNFKILSLYSVLEIINGVYLAYQVYAFKNQYVEILQTVVLIGITVLLSLGILLSLVEHYRIWIHKVWSLCDGCCMWFKLWGSSKKVYDAEESQRKMIKVEEVKEGEVIQVDAFYARVLKKEALNKRYKKERMIRDPVPTFDKEFMM